VNEKKKNLEDIENFLESKTNWMQVDCGLISLFLSFSEAETFKRSRIQIRKEIKQFYLFSNWFQKGVKRDEEGRVESFS
jgi:hypothetical protein